MRLAPAAYAQTAQVTGRVTDTTDAVIPGTTIRVINVATAASREVTTNAVGYCTVPLLPPGRYRIEVEALGFKPINRTGIILAVDQKAEMNFKMEVGRLTEQIEVTADAFSSILSMPASTTPMAFPAATVQSPAAFRRWGLPAMPTSASAHSTPSTAIRRTGSWSATCTG